MTSIHLKRSYGPIQTVAMIFAIVLISSSCRLLGFRHIKGNGIIGSQTRVLDKANKIKLAGGFDVELVQGNTVELVITGDENILPYIITEEKDGFLVIKTKNFYSYSSKEDIRVHITTPRLEAVQIAGSGNVIGKGKFNGGDKLSLKIAGSGDIRLEMNTPVVTTEIAGSGSILLAGETRDQTIKIAGSGSYRADSLKSENAKVNIAGNGDVRLYASAQLDVHIAGSGTIYYRGNPSIKQKIAGSGEIKKID